MVGRDPTNPMSVVGAQQGFTGQPHAVQQRTSAGNAGVALMPFAPCSTVVFACVCTCQLNQGPQLSALLLSEHLSNEVCDLESGYV